MMSLNFIDILKNIHVLQHSRDTLFYLSAKVTFSVFFGTDLSLFMDRAAPVSGYMALPSDEIMLPY